VKKPAGSQWKNGVHIYIGSHFSAVSGCFSRLPSYTLARVCLKTRNVWAVSDHTIGSHYTSGLKTTRGSH